MPGLFRLGLSVPARVVARTAACCSWPRRCIPTTTARASNLGGEWTCGDLLALRAGYQTLFQEDSDVGLTLGFGVRGRLGETRFQFDYAWADHEYLEDTHRLTLGAGVLGGAP